MKLMYSKRPPNHERMELESFDRPPRKSYFRR